MTAMRRSASGERRRRGAYLLPSLFTIGSIFLGFYSLIVGIRGDFKSAALLLFAAAFLDGLDGRIARLTHTDSEFGKQYDSLADVITFGMTPALLAYFWGLDELGRLGWMVPLFYLVCTATRLARFNVQSRITDSRYFVGLAAPAAAGVMGSILFFAPDRAWRTWISALLMFVLVSLGLLMLSTFRYYSFKELDFRRRWSYRIALPIVGIVLLVAYNPAAFFLGISVTYALSGPLLWIQQRLRSSPAPESALDPREVD